MTSCVAAQAHTVKRTASQKPNPAAMRTLCLLGGMTPQVTSLYYDLINATVRQKLGARHSARMFVYSVDLESQLKRVEGSDWTGFAKEFTDALAPLIVRPNVDGVLLGAIIAHKVSALIESTLPEGVQFLDAARFVAERLLQDGIKTVGLLGPATTMLDDSPDFFRGKLERQHGIKVIIPSTEAEQAEVQRAMFEEVVKGPDAIRPDTRKMFLRTANKLIDDGAQALILGSTDLGFVLNQADFEGKAAVIDVAQVHAVGVANWALQDS